jgi:Fic family protein
MFKPKYKYTDKIVELLTSISSAREVILNSPLIPRWEVSLRKDAIIRSAHSSTSIEGNNLSLEQVSELATGRKIMAKRKDKQEVLNYIKVLEKLDTLAKGGIITEDVVKNIHNMLTVDTLEDPQDCGVYRCVQMFKITRQASLKEIDRMIKLELVKREGKARASHYVMK